MNENEKRADRFGMAVRDFFVILACIGIIVGILWCAAIRADSTKVWQAIEKPKLTVCEKVCPVCGNCYPGWSMIQHDMGGMHTYVCSKKNALFDIDDCDGVIVWGRYRTICRVDTVQVPPESPFGELKNDTMWIYNPAYGIGIRIDTIYTDDPRCDTIPRARGLDSTFNLQEKVWYYYDWLNGKRVNMRRVK